VTREQPRKKGRTGIIAARRAAGDWGGIRAFLVIAASRAYCPRAKAEKLAWLASNNPLFIGILTRCGSRTRGPGDVASFQAASFGGRRDPARWAGEAGARKGKASGQENDACGIISAVPDGTRRPLAQKPTLEWVGYFLSPFGLRKGKSMHTYRCKPHDESHGYLREVAPRRGKGTRRRGRIPHLRFEIATGEKRGDRLSPPRKGDYLGNDTAETPAWATVNKLSGGGKKSGAGGKTSCPWIWGAVSANETRPGTPPRLPSR